jgi:hypothetical protein
MSTKKLFHWGHLEQLRRFTDILDQEHSITTSKLIKEKLQASPAAWCACKKKSFRLQQKLLFERAQLMAEKMHSSQEKAPKALFSIRCGDISSISVTTISQVWTFSYNIIHLPNLERNRTTWDYPSTSKKCHMDSNSSWTGWLFSNGNCNNGL